jgi:hypothetical protein
MSLMQTVLIGSTCQLAFFYLLFSPLTVAYCSDCCTATLCFKDLVLSTVIGVALPTASFLCCFCPSCCAASHLAESGNSFLTAAECESKALNTAEEYELDAPQSTEKGEVQRAHMPTVAISPLLRYYSLSHLLSLLFSSAPLLCLHSVVS